MFTLRRYRPEDFPRLLEIDRACFVEGIAYEEREMRSFLHMPHAFTLVAGESGKIQGFIICHRLQRRKTTRAIGRIITLDVSPESRRRGLGALLLGRAEEELQSAGCDHVVLEVAVDNENALRFYKKHGYSALKVLPHYYLDSIDGLRMGKKL